MKSSSTFCTSHPVHLIVALAVWLIVYISTKLTQLVGSAHPYLRRLFRSVALNVRELLQNCKPYTRANEHAVVQNCTGLWLSEEKQTRALLSLDLMHHHVSRIRLFTFGESGERRNELACNTRCKMTIHALLSLPARPYYRICNQ